MLRKIEKNAKSKEEALELAAEEFGVSVDELSYKVEREVGKGLMGLILGKEVIISAWITKEAEEEDGEMEHGYSGRRSYNRGGASYARGRSPMTGRYMSREMGYDDGRSGYYPMEYMEPYHRYY